MAKSSLFTTLQFIADILSFQPNQKALRSQITQEDVDWEQMVIIGSGHLMLPAIYCRLKDKKLLSIIPEDLSVYLEEITRINRNRNQQLLKEIHAISELFQTEKIEHVFIKGAALLASNIFSDFGERMVSDIDILVSEKQIHKAFDLLTAHGYNETVTSIIEKKNRRHLPRQVSSEKFGAIELHSEVLIQKYKHHIINHEILKKKVFLNGIAVPSTEDFIMIAILAFQINDKAYIYKSLRFRPIYDCLALNLHLNQTLLLRLSKEKHTQSFLHLANIFFKEFILYKSTRISKLSRSYYILRLNKPRIGRLMNFTLICTLSISSRVNLLFYNKSYRVHIIRNKLNM